MGGRLVQSVRGEGRDVSTLYGRGGGQRRQRGRRLPRPHRMAPMALGHRAPARDADPGARGGARGGGAAGRASSMSGPGSHRAPP